MVQTNISLRPYNTFGIEARAAFFVRASSVQQLQGLLRDPQLAQMPRLVLGGGSNLLLTGDFEGLVIQIDLQGIEKIAEDDTHVLVRAGAGVVWHSLVMYAIEQNLGGIENLSLIPGTVGAAPMQNIGAYGVELKDVFHSLEALEISSGQIHHFDREACRFGYRQSIFKQQAKDRYIIVSVTLRLSKQHLFNTSYGAISTTLQEMGVQQLSIRAISQAVIQIRRSKLPDPALIGNAGSFFKNPEIPQAHFEQLKASWSDLPGYPSALPGQVKIPAGWLIEKCGWKGRVAGNTGCHKDQALVLVNYGQASGQEIWQLAMDIQASVRQTFAVELQPEVNVV